MRKRRHMSVNIEWMLKVYKGKQIDVLMDEHGKYLTDGQARLYIYKLQSEGYKLLPNESCEGFDPFGGGCPGHEIKE